MSARTRIDFADLDVVLTRAASAALNNEGVDADREPEAEIPASIKLGAAALAWLAEHAADVPAELPPASKLEPAQRGHRGHTVKVALDPDVLSCGADGDPLAWLAAREAIAERVSRVSRNSHDAILLHDARVALDVIGRRAPGWTGRPTAQRTAERRRAEERIATAAGQLGFWCAGAGESP